MKMLQRFVVAALLAVWMFPAVSLAKPLPAASAEVDPRTSPTSSPRQPPADDEAATFAAREQQSSNLETFKGGGLYIYMGSGAVLVLLIVLLILVV